VHGDSRGHPGVDRPGGTELGDGHRDVGFLSGLVGQTGRLGPEQQQSFSWQLRRFQRNSTRQIVDRHHAQSRGRSEI